MAGWRTSAAYRERVSSEKAEWQQEVERIYRGSGSPVVSQGAVIGLVNEFTGPRDVIVNAAGSLPGDLHKLWRARDPKQYHLDYGYSRVSESRWPRPIERFTCSSATART